MLIAKYLVAVVLGLAFGLFSNGYWLVDYLPTGSRRLLFLTLLFTIFGIIGYSFLLTWISARLREVRVYASQFVELLLGSIAVGCFLFFAGTSQWQSPARYLPFFLPSQNLQVFVPEGRASEISISWFNTSFGDVSFQDFRGNGWKRQGDNLTLINPDNSKLTWSGKLGNEAQIIFLSSSSGTVIIDWGGEKETLELSPGKNTYLRSFSVPFYASRELILLLGILHFTIFSFAGILEFWMRRIEWTKKMKDSITGTEKLNRFDIFFLLGMIILAFLLRVQNVGILYPNVDEYYHLLAAKQIVEGVPFQDVYQRGLLTITLPTALMFKLFGTELWAVRLPGVIFNVLALIPLYLLSLKINRPTGIISALLYATSPWVITFSRLVREYAYFPFYYYWIIYVAVLFYNRIPPRFVIRRDWKQFLKVDTLLLVFSLIFPIWYALYDSSSTFKLILIAYVILGIFIFQKLEIRNQKILLLLFFIGFLLGLGYLILGSRISDNLRLVFHPEITNYFFPNPPQQWYFNRLVFIPAFAFILAVMGSILIWKKNSAPLFILTLLLGLLVLFLFLDFGGRPLVRVRFLQVVELWYIILLSFGMYILWTFLRMIFGNLSIAIAILIGVASINFQQVILPVVSTSETTTIAPSDIYYHNVGAAYEYILANSMDKDVLIGITFIKYVEWVHAPEFQAIYALPVSSGAEQVSSVIDDFESGWIVLDQIEVDIMRYDPFLEFEKNEKIKFVGLFSDQYVWRWKK